MSKGYLMNDFTRLPNEYVISDNLSDSEFRTLVVLLLHDFKTGDVNPSIKRLSELRGLSERQILRHIKKLCDVNIIKIVKNKCDGNLSKKDGRSNFYEFIRDKKEIEKFRNIFYSKEKKVTFEPKKYVTSGVTYPKIGDICDTKKVTSGDICINIDEEDKEKKTTTKKTVRDEYDIRDGNTCVHRSSKKNSKKMKLILSGMIDESNLNDMICKGRKWLISKCVSDKSVRNIQGENIAYYYLPIKNLSERDDFPKEAGGLYKIFSEYWGESDREKFHKEKYNLIAKKYWEKKVSEKKRIKTEANKINQYNLLKSKMNDNNFYNGSEMLNVVKQLHYPFNIFLITKDEEILFDDIDWKLFSISSFKNVKEKI